MKGLTRSERLKFFLLPSCLAALAALAMGLPAPGAASDLLGVGTTAPDFVVTAHTGEQISLSKYKGKFVVLYFYPADDTPGCTKEACELRDNWAELQRLGVVVFGVSTQDNKSHQDFATKHSLPFALLPDTDAELARRYGVPVRVGFASRVTFLIGRTGKIAHVWPRVDPLGHAAQIIERIKSD